MTETLRPNFTVPFSKPDATKEDGSPLTSIALKQVEDTSCDDIEFILYNKKGLAVDLATTVGSAASLGEHTEELDEAITISGGKSAGVGTPGVVAVRYLALVGQVLVLRPSGLVPGGAGQFVFDMEKEEVTWTGEDDVFAVVRVQYRSRGRHFGFRWGLDKGAKEAVVAAVASDGNKASLTLSRADCQEDPTDDHSTPDDAAENTQLTFDLKMDAGWTAVREIKLGPLSLYGMLHVYPVHTTGKPEFRAAFGKTGKLVECMFTESPGFNPFRDISESINFSSSSIANVGNFVGSFSNFTITAESTFYDEKNNRILSPSFRKPGESVDIDKWVDGEKTVTDPASGQTRKINIRQKVRYSRTLGPTEVACVTAMGVVQPVTGVARVNYRVPQKVGIIKVDINVTEQDYKEWMCVVHGSYQYRDLAVDSSKPIVFIGKTTLNSPINSSPALDARELAIQRAISA